MLQVCGLWCWVVSSEWFSGDQLVLDLTKIQENDHLQRVWKWPIIVTCALKGETRHLCTISSCFQGFFPGSPASYRSPKSRTGSYGALVFPRWSRTKVLSPESVEDFKWACAWSPCCFDRGAVLVSRWPRIENLASYRVLHWMNPCLVGCCVFAEGGRV